MMPRRLFWSSALVALSVLQAADAWALGLGRARGAVLIGRPLNVAIAGTAEAGDPDTPCVEADVFQGDYRVLPRQVHARWEAGAAGSGTVRITTDVVVEEPVVTIYLRVGCTSKVTRKYVMLSEQPVEAETPQSVPAVVSAAVPARPAAASAAAVPPLPFPAGTPSTGAPATARPSAQAQAQAEPLRIQPAARLAPAARGQDTAERKTRAAPAAAPQRPAGARLKLEPLDLSTQRDPTLKSSGKLENEPGNDEERRRQAAAMWKALSAGPEEAMRNSERLQVLERDVRALNDVMRKNTAILELMRDQTEKARGERNILALVALGLALLAAVVAVAWIWRSRGAAGQRASWWGGRSVGPESEFASEPPHRQATRVSAHDPSVPASEAPDIDLNEPVPFVRPPPPPVAIPAAAPKFMSSRWSLSDFHSSVPGNSRMMKAEELIDIQQQADFFLSIDQPDRAIQLLESHLQQQEETSALAWMDLLAIYHNLGRKDDYDRIREGFHERFNAQVPDFEDYKHEQGGLENYGRAMSRIISLWPTPRVLEVIEESLLRRPGSADSEAFDLEAYRELVLLYNIGREVAQDPVAEAAIPLPEVNFGDTKVMSLSDLNSAANAGPETLPPSDASLDIDLDLGEFSKSKPPSVPDTGKRKPVDDNPVTDLDALDWRSLR